MIAASKQCMKRLERHFGRPVPESDISIGHAAHGSAVFRHVSSRPWRMNQTGVQSVGPLTCCI